MSTSLSTKLASAKTSLGKRDSKLSKTVGYYAGFVILGLVIASLGPTLLSLSEQTQSQISQISYLFTARSLGYMLGSVYSGRLYDRMAGHHVLVGMLIVIAVMVFLVPLIPLLWLLILVMLIMGGAEGGLDVGSNTLLIWIYRDKVGSYMNGLHFFFGVGAFVSPLIIAWAVLVSGDITIGYWILALLVLPVVVWLLRLESPEHPSEVEKNRAGKINYLLVLLVAAFLFLYVGAEASYGGWIYTFAVQQLNLSGLASAAYLTSAFWGALTLGRLLSIPIATRYRPRTILLVDLIGCLVSIAIILIWSQSILAIWISTLGLGLFMASIFPTALSLAERRMMITGKVTGWFFVGVGAGAMTIPWMVGQLFEGVGPQVLLFALTIDLLFALGLYIWLISISNRTAEIYTSSE